MEMGVAGEALIAGRWAAGEGDPIEVENPATGEIAGMLNAVSETQLDAAVNAAHGAFPSWSALPPVARAKLLRRSGEIIAERAADIARTMTIEQGKPLNEARGEVDKLAQTFWFYAEEAVRVHGEVIPNDSTDYQSLVVREPIGVVAAISPWNYPAELIGWKLAAALAAGCTIVIKPPELTPYTALAIGRCLTEAGLPEGVVSIVPGTGRVVGQALIEHKLVDKIAFTGSNAVGLHIQQSMTTIKRLSLELGGNCPMIVTDSADLDAAVQGAARRSFRNMGQICIAINRIYVAQSLYEPFLERLVKAANSLVIANGLDNPAADLGPMASADPLEKTRRHLADALERGARLLAGGSIPDGEEFKRGHFFRPTVVADCTPEMKVMKEETFGPLVGVASFSTLSEAADLANASLHGLAAYVYTKHMDEMRFLTARLDFGSVAVNNVDAGIINAPYGGRKQSGVGYEHGREGMLEYLNLKHIRIRYDNPEGGR